MTSHYYILDESGEPKPVNLDEWVKWMSEAGASTGGAVNACTINRTTVGDKWISTVFLALNHGMGGEPLLYETLIAPIVDGVPDMGAADIPARYATREEAEKGHDEFVRKAINENITHSTKEDQ